MADAVGKSKVTLAQVVRDFLSIVPSPILAGGFAMAHHGCVRATVDIDVLAVGKISDLIQKFEQLGYKNELLRVSIGEINLLSKGNKGVDFIHLENIDFRSSVIDRAMPGIFFAENVSFVSLEDLILLKRLAIRGRTRKMDEADLENLLALKYDQVYVRDWEAKLGLKV